MNKSISEQLDEAVKDITKLTEEECRNKFIYNPPSSDKLDEVKPICKGGK